MDYLMKRWLQLPEELYSYFYIAGGSLTALFSDTLFRIKPSFRDIDLFFNSKDNFEKIYEYICRYKNWNVDIVTTKAITYYNDYNRKKIH